MGLLFVNKTENCTDVELGSIGFAVASKNCSTQTQNLIGGHGFVSVCFGLEPGRLPAICTPQQVVK